MDEGIAYHGCKKFHDTAGGELGDCCFVPICWQDGWKVRKNKCR